MLKAALLSARPATRSVAPQIRAFSTTLRTLSAKHDHHAKEGLKELPELFGPGGKPGEIPTDFEQATGLERLQLLGEMAGVPFFDKEPLDASRVGTKKNPILVLSYSPERIVGCTGSPAGSHDIRWFTLEDERQSRCTECGSVYQLDYDHKLVAEAATYAVPKIFQSEH